MENNANQIDMEIIDSLFEELNKKINEGSFMVTDAACNSNNTIAGGPFPSIDGSKLSTAAW